MTASQVPGPPQAAGIPLADEPRPGRRSILRHGAVGTGLALVGAAGTGSAVALTHHIDTHLAPTDRVAPLPSRPAGLAARVVFHADPVAATACVTFDDGPDPRWTPLVLQVLEEAGVPATFFVLGRAVQNHPGLIARQVEAGHEVAVHNWEHTDVYGVEIDQLRSSVDRTMAAITAAGAPRPRLWRPPYGRVDAPALMVAAERGLDILLWSHHTPSAAEAAAIAQRAGAGSVILCHDGRSQPNEAMIRSLGRSIRELVRRGVSFVTGSEILARA